MGAKAILVLLKVNDIHRKMREIDRSVDVRHWPMDGTGPTGNSYNDESHSGIFGVETNPEVTALALSQVECEIVPAKAA